jgi:hypothetical protein
LTRTDAQAVEGMMLLEREERGLEAHDYNQLLLSGMRVRALRCCACHHLRTCLNT